MLQLISMKKSLKLLTLLCLPAFSLTACSDLLDMFYFGGSINQGGGYQSISTPPPGGDVPEYAPTDFTYKKYVSNNAYPISATPALNNAKLLVIPVWFTDSTTYVAMHKRDQVREDIEATYFGTNEETGWRSVKTYYEEESHGKLTITGSVSDWYECGSSVSYYATDPSMEKMPVLVKDAVDWYFNGHPEENKTDYDCDSDGYLDGVMLIYAAPDYQVLSNPSVDNLWAYCYCIQDKTVKKVTNPGANAFFWASYDFMYSKSRAAARAGTNYGNGDTSHANIDAHTYIHEMGHMFGLVDYYDYTKQYDPAGGFSMQDQNIGGHDPFSSFALGWGKAYVPVDSTVIDLKPFSTSGEMIILKSNPSSYNYSPFDEYLILEYFTPTGLNEFDCEHKYMESAHKDYSRGSKTPGIRVWHIDARLLYPESLHGGKYHFREDYQTTAPTFSSTYGVTLMLSNTYYSSSVDETYISPLGASYSDYNVLQLIRNSSSYNHKVPSQSSNLFSASSLFRGGDTFSMIEFNKQFVKKHTVGGQTVAQFNNGEDLGFSFTVNGTLEDYASITITKL